MAGNFREIDIVAAYKNYTADVKKKISKAARKNGGLMLDEIVLKSPVRRVPNGHKVPKNANPGEYKAGWAKTVKNTETGVRVIVHNKLPGLVPLQELPHKTGAEGKNRGAYPASGQNDVIGSVRAANKKYSDKLNDEIEKILKE